MTKQGRGRPHDPEIAGKLREAAEQIMLTEGFSGLSVDRLAKEVGTTRPTFYRRYPTMGYLALDVLQHRFGPGEEVDTGSLKQDLLVLQEHEVAMFSDPLIQKNLAALLELSRTEPDIAALTKKSFVEMRRQTVHRVIDRAVERGEIKTPHVAFDFLCDLLLGPVVVRTLLPVPGQLDEELARSTALTVLALLTND